MRTWHPDWEWLAGSLADPNYEWGEYRNWPRGSSTGYSMTLVRSFMAICLNALSLEYENAESDEDQREQPSEGKGFLQQDESNKHDDTHLGRCDQRR